MEHIPALMRPGDRDTWNSLIGRYLPRLQRFAERHLPAQLRTAITAEDVLHEAVMTVSRQLHRLEFRHEHAFLAYLQTSIRHRIVDEIRRMRCQPDVVPFDEQANRHVDRLTSLLRRFIARESGESCEKAFAHLAERDRQLIVLRMLRRLPHRDVAVRLGMRTEAAARMAVKRALRRLKTGLTSGPSSGKRTHPSSAVPFHGSAPRFRDHVTSRDIVRDRGATAWRSTPPAAPAASAPAARLLIA